MIALHIVDNDIVDSAIQRGRDSKRPRFKKAAIPKKPRFREAAVQKKNDHTKKATEEVMKRLLSYAKPYRAATILAVICIVTEAFLELIIPRDLFSFSIKLFYLSSDKSSCLSLG